MSSSKFNLSHITAGFTTVLVGYTSSVVIVIQAATAAGATAEQIQSWLLALGVGIGLICMLFSWWYKKPMVFAWSTPGAAMLVTVASQYDLPIVIGAFVMTGALIVLTGLITPLSHALARIPAYLGTAMLGAILLPFCLKAFQPLASQPISFLCMFIGYLLAKRLVPKYSMLILLIIAVVVTLVGGGWTSSGIDFSLAQPSWMAPSFDWLAIVNLSLPLYVLTMLSQNLPGVAMLKSHGYEAPVKPVLIGTGLLNMAFAPLGGFSVNLAAISAAICMNEHVDTDSKQRYRAAIWAGVFYVIAGLWATAVVALFLALPKDVSNMLAGFALLGTLLMCLNISFREGGFQEAALMTFLITLSGVTFLGIGSTLWGLLTGLVLVRFSPTK